MIKWYFFIYLYNSFFFFIAEFTFALLICEDQALGLFLVQVK